MERPPLCLGAAGLTKPGVLVVGIRATNTPIVASHAGTSGLESN
jgi:hypothetical protein